MNSRIAMPRKHHSIKHSKQYKPAVQMLKELEKTPEFKMVKKGK